MNLTDVSDKLITYAHEGYAEHEVYADNKKVKDIVMRGNKIIILCEDNNEKNTSLHPSTTTKYFGFHNLEELDI